MNADGETLDQRSIIILVIWKKDSMSDAELMPFIKLTL